jgi:triacylglycerol lipase
MPTHIIILTHGILGFGNLFGLPFPFEAPINYFNGIAKHLLNRVDKVIEPQVATIGSVQERGRMLAEVILKQPRGSRIDIIAHSMGGLDARYALATNGEVAQRVTALVTIGTPHLGSPVADALFNSAHQLAKFVPPFIKEQSGALGDLTTNAAKTFNHNTQDVDGVHYLNIAGNAALGTKSFFYALGTEIAKLGYGINDGVVPRSSALYTGHTHLPDWPVDHAGEIGWSTDILFPILNILPINAIPSGAKEHFDRYDNVLAALKALRVLIP